MNIVNKDRGIELLQEAVTTLRTEGSRELTIETLEFLRDNIKDDYKERRRVMQNYDSDRRYLNIGGKKFVRNNWRVLNYVTPNSDYNEIPKKYIDYNIDLEKKEEWAIDNSSYDLVFSSATLEHLSPETAIHVLEECHRILKPGGGILLTKPDVDVAIRKYEQKDLDWIHNIKGLGDESYHPIYHKCPPEYEPEFFLIRWFAGPLLYKEYPHTQEFEEFLSLVRKDWLEMNKNKFLNKYRDMVSDEHFNLYRGGHRNWYNERKLKSQLNKTGFQKVERIYTQQSRFTEFCQPEFMKRPQWSVHVEAEVPDIESN